MDFKQELIKLLSKETKIPEADFTNLITIPPDPKLGDYAFPCFKLGGNPKEAAEKLKAKLKLPKFIERVEVTGPYLNFFTNKSLLTEQTLTDVIEQKNKYGKGTGKKAIVVEFCSPNTNKPLHLGHVRNMALGEAMCNLLSFQGHNIHPVEIVKVRGVHICNSMLAYQRWGDKKQPDKKTDHFVGDYYVLFAQKAKDDPDLEKEAQEMLVKWEQGEKEVRALWKKMNAWVLDGFQQTYKRFGIKFEKEYYESEFYVHGKDIAQEGLKKGLFFKDETGAVMVDLEKYGLGKKAVLRSDGTSIYFTQDLYLAELRQKDYRFNQLLYVVANEQNLHFKQLFKVLELLGRSYASNLYHLSYGMVNLPTGKMKSREGTVVDADDILDELSALAEKEVLKRYENISEKEVKRRGEFIALGAIKFFMLKTDAVKEMIFNPEESISFEGETGPYIQYTHARSCSILKKAKKEITLKNTELDYSLLKEKEEQAIIRLMYDFPLQAAKAAEQHKPHLIANYLISLSQAFNEFYHVHQVISEDKKLMQARLLLVDSVRQVLENGLNLLGIHAPEEM